MANHSQQQNATSSFPWFSSSECIAWLTVLGTEAVATVALNVLTIIVYLKERSLRKRSLYLVINQAVADMLVAGCVIIGFYDSGSNCKFWASINSSNIPSAIVTKFWFRFIPLASVTNLAAISLEQLHATFRPFKHRLIKKNMFGAVVAAVWITAGLFSAIGVLDVFYPFIKLSRSLFISYLTVFMFCLLIILVSYSSIAIKVICGNQPHHHGATSRERKLTKTLFIVTFISLLLMQPTIFFLDSRFSVITHFHRHFTSDMVSVILFFWFFIVCQLSCQSSLLCI